MKCLLWFISYFTSKFVTNTPDGSKSPCSMIFDLLAETFDMYVYCTGIANVFISPDLIQKLLSCEHLIRRSSKEIEKFQFLWRHIDSLTIHNNRIVGKVNGNARIFDTLLCLPPEIPSSAPVGSDGEQLLHGQPFLWNQMVS